MTTVMERGRRIAQASLVAVGVLVAVLPTLAQAPSIGGYVLVSDVRVTRTIDELTYRAVLTNGTDALSGATATAVSLTPATTIVDGTMTFGAVDRGGSVGSSDTFSFRQDRTVPFSWSNIRWTISAKTANHPPVANAGPAQTVVVATTVTLNGSASNDADGDPLTYAWSFQSRPAGSGATLSSTTSLNPTFVVDRPGTYIVRLVVNDGIAASAAATVAISTLNSAPAANAGADQTVFVGQSVALNGNGSSDVDGNSLTFLWSFVARPSGSTAALVGPATINPTFVPDRPGTYQVRLVVNDGLLDSAPDIVVVTTKNSAPVANAGPDQSTVVGATITLDGSASSDVDGDPLTYQWSLTAVPTGTHATLNNSTGATPTFVVDKPGTYVAQLIVRDGTTASVPDTVSITTLNSRPVANPGPDQSIVAGHLALLDGSLSSDADGDTLSYQWSFVTRPLGSSAVLANPLMAGASFVADRTGSYVVQLIVSDGALSSVPKTVTVATTNTAPVANAGPDQLSVRIGSTVTVDGFGSTDADGHGLTYLWSLLSKPQNSAAAIVAPSSVDPTFVVDTSGDYIAQLIVNDGFVNSAPDTVLIRAVNAPPVANAGLDQNVVTGATVHLDGSASSDPDQQTIGYQWSFTSAPSGSAAALTAATTVSPTFVADVDGQYTVQLTVTDSLGATASDAVVVTSARPAVPLVTIAASDQNASEVGPDPGVFRFTRSGSTSSPLTVTYSIGGTATNSVDYLAIVSSIVFPSGQATVDLTITPIPDSIVEGPETVTLTLVDGAEYDLGSQTSAVVTIADTPLAPSFTLTLASLTASAFADSTTLIAFTVDRVGGLSTPITVGLASPPAGLSAENVQMFEGIADGAVVVAVPQDVPPGDLTITVTASSGVLTRTQQLTLTIQAAQPRSQSLIRDAMIAGTLDRQTSLLYRAYALFGDSRLPALYSGSGSENEDGTLLSDISAFLPLATPDVRAQLEQFTLRPGHPQSWYSQIAPPPVAAMRTMLREAGGPLDADAAFDGTSLPSDCSELDGSNLWISKRSATHPFRIWAQCIAENPAAATILIDHVAATFEKIWQPMVNVMGSPIADAPAGGAASASDGVGDDAIDIYLVLPGRTVTRLGQTFSRSRHAAGSAFSWGSGGQRSGFIILPIVQTVLQPRLHSTAIHELFHVLQFAHNATLADGFALPGFGGLSAPPTASWWYIEASANWAEAHFDHTLEPWDQGRSAYPEVYSQFSGFQTRGSTTALNALGSDRAYEAFIWPYFMEQKTGGAASPASVWTAVQSATTPDAADGAMSGVFPFATNFREFAVRDLNLKLDPGDPLPRTDRFVGLDDHDDGFKPADGILPVHENQVIAGAGTLDVPVRIAPLAAQYTNFLLTAAQVHKVVFTLPDNLAVDAFVKIKDHDWQRKDYNGQSRVSFCLDVPDEALEAIWLIVSNPVLAPPATGPTESDIKVEASVACSAWVGTAIYDEQSRIFPNAHLRTTANVEWTLSPNSPPPFLGLDSFTPSGSLAINVFEANGCVATVTPSTVLINPTAGHLLINRNSTPNIASGDGAAGIVARITDCQGRVQDGIPLTGFFMAGDSIELNAAGDEITAHIVIEDDQVSLITLDVSYKKIPH